MGKKTKLREAQRLADEHAIAARLKERAATKDRRIFIESYRDFPAQFRVRIEPYRKFAVRAPEGWRCGLRIRSYEHRFMELVRFTFANYPIPRHLENAWCVDPQAAPQLGAPAGDDQDARDNRADFRRWYITVAQGGSLYKVATRRYMTRLETHHFVHVPYSVETTQQAFWYAFARAQADDQDTALRVARTRLVYYPVESKFWQDAARFFARNSTGVLEMNDLIDFIAAARGADEAFSLAGRTLPALRERMNEWHRALRNTADGLRWAGSDLPDVVYPIETKEGRNVWRFRQIKNDYDLQTEGERMSHCVSTYRYECAMGTLSIWSLACETADKVMQRRLTIELRRDGTIAQCRGPCNRAPTVEEAEIVRRWAEDNLLTPEAYELRAA